MIRKFISWIDRGIYQIAIKKNPLFDSVDSKDFWTENHHENPIVQRFLQNPFDKFFFPKAYYLFFFLPVFVIWLEWDSLFANYFSILFLSHVTAYFLYDIFFLFFGYTRLKVSSQSSIFHDLEYSPMGMALVEKSILLCNMVLLIRMQLIILVPLYVVGLYKVLYNLPVFTGVSGYIFLGFCFWLSGMICPVRYLQSVVTFILSEGVENTKGGLFGLFVRYLFSRYKPIIWSRWMLFPTGLILLFSFLIYVASDITQVVIWVLSIFIFISALFAIPIFVSYMISCDMILRNIKLIKKRFGEN